MCVYLEVVQENCARGFKLCEMYMYVILFAMPQEFLHNFTVITQRDFSSTCMSGQAYINIISHLKSSTSTVNGSSSTVHSRDSPRRTEQEQTSTKPKPGAVGKPSFAGVTDIDDLLGADDGFDDDNDPFFDDPIPKRETKTFSSR